MPDSTGILVQFQIKLNGTVIADGVVSDVLNVTVESSIHLPDVCTIRLNAFDVNAMQMKYVDDDTFSIGKKVEVWGGDESMSSLGKLFSGEVAGLELDLASHGLQTLVVRCYSKSHRLHRGRKTKTYVQVTDGDVANQVISAAGLTGEVDSTTTVHDWIVQSNQTDWEFLSARAVRCGYRLYMSMSETGERLCFKKVVDPGSADVTVHLFEDLRSFRPRINAAAQVDTVEVRGWDWLQKQAIVSTATSALGLPQSVGQSPGGSVASAAFGGSAKMVVVDRPIFAQGESDAIAQSVYDDIAGEFLEAEALAAGNPSIKAGAVVDVQGVGTRFGGKYFVTSATHVFAAHEGYSTIFTVTGKRPATVLSSMDGGAFGGARASVGANIVVGVVTNNNDDQNLGRVKVKYDWLGENVESGWAKLAAPMGGSARGMHYLPEIDDEVLLAFEQGDIRRPYVIGALWNKTDMPPLKATEAVESQKVVRRVITSRLGHYLIFKDGDDKGGITLKTAVGHSVELHDTDADNFIFVNTKHGHNIKLDDANDKIIVVDKTGNNKMTIQTSDNSIAMECVGDFSVTCKGNFKVDATQGIAIKTPAQASFEGTGGMTIKSTAMTEVDGTSVTVKGTAQTQVQGAQVAITGNAEVQVQAPMVMIN